MRPKSLPFSIPALVRSLTIVSAAPLLLISASGSQAQPVTSVEAPTHAEHNEIWAVLSGGSLKSTIEGWARVSGWTVVWDNPVDYRIRASATFQGAFEEAVAGLVDAIHQVSPELTVTLYRGNRVLHVEDTARLRN